MSISQDPAPIQSADGQPHEKHQSKSGSVSSNGGVKASEASIQLPTGENASLPADFEGDVDTNDTLPTQALLRKVQDFALLDEESNAIPFKSLYTGFNVARRVLVIFVRHFFCGNCQEYIRTLTETITPSALLSLPVPTNIIIIGCGSPSLIGMYRDTTSCPFPIYADPTKHLYTELGMTQTLALGPRPAYARKSLLHLSLNGIAQGLRRLHNGTAFQGGAIHQVGGEFLFEPLGDEAPQGTDVPDPEKRVTWCHRMRNTRDHAEMPVLRARLGLVDGDGDGAGPRD